MEKSRISNWLKKKKIFFSDKDFNQAFSYTIKNNRPFLTLSIKKNQKPEILKLLIPGSKSYLKKALLNETVAHRILPKIFNQRLEYYAGVPDLIEKNFSNPSFVYFIREEIPGKPAGDSFNYKKGRLDKQKVIRIIHSLKQFSRLSLNNFSFNEPYKINQKRWGEEILKNLANEITPKTKKIINFSKIIALSQEAFSGKIPSPVPVHGDIIPGNIIISKESNLFLIDWEKIFPGSLFYDYATLYSSLWPEPILQKEILEFLIKQNKKEYEQKKLEFLFFSVCHMVIIYLNSPNKFLLKNITRALK